MLHNYLRVFVICLANFPFISLQFHNYLARLLKSSKPAYLLPIFFAHTPKKKLPQKANSICTPHKQAIGNSRSKIHFWRHYVTLPLKRLLSCFRSNIFAKDESKTTINKSLVTMCRDDVDMRARTCLVLCSSLVLLLFFCNILALGRFCFLLQIWWMLLLVNRVSPLRKLRPNDIRAACPNLANFSNKSQTWSKKSAALIYSFVP